MKLRILLPALALAIGTEAGAQMYKCKDAAGRITYSSQDCAAIGLIPVGEVQEKVNVAPAFKAPPPPKPSPAQAAKPAPKPSPAPMAADPDKKKEPERRCFVVQTPKGPVTRCNEKPEDDDKK